MVRIMFQVMVWNNRKLFIEVITIDYVLYTGSKVLTPCYTDILALYTVFIIFSLYYHPLFGTASSHKHVLSHLGEANLHTHKLSSGRLAGLWHTVTWHWAEETQWELSAQWIRVCCQPWTRSKLEIINPTFTGWDQLKKQRKKETEGKEIWVELTIIIKPFCCSYIL